MNDHLGVCIIVVQSQTGKVALGQRKGGYAAGAYGLPGGRVEFGENLDQAADRELWEETGQSAGCLQKLGAVREFRSTQYTFTHFIYVKRDFAGELVNAEPDKCEGWEWYSLQELPGSLLPAHRAALTMLVSGEPFVDIDSSEP